jgi:adenylate cyclase
VENLNGEKREIERRFLLKEEPRGLKVISRSKIFQTYLASGGQEQVRIRRRIFLWCDKPDEYTLDVKLGRGMDKKEIPTAISKDTYWQMQRNIKRKPLVKVRTEVLCDGRIVAIDKFLDKETTVVEVEFKSVRDANNFIPPTWFGKEITRR